MTPAEEAAVREGAARIAALGATTQQFADMLQRLAGCGWAAADLGRRHAERPKTA